MKIGLYNLEPKMVNSAMMRVSTYHKNKGDEVKIYNAFENFDKIYCFSLFTFTKKDYVTQEMICGGTGFDITTKLPPEIEDQEYDWSLYPDCDFSIIWFSIGCIRNCPFCIVRKKEGLVQPIEPKNLNPNGTYVKIQDNNFFASPKWREAIQQLKDWGLPVDFCGGIDVRLLDREQCEALNSLKHRKQIKIAWDNPKDDLRPHLERMLKYIKPYKVACYVLTGYWSTPEEDLYRVETLRKLKIDPFAMNYNKADDKYLKDFSRWVNRKQLFKSVKWEDYKAGKYGI